MSKKINRFTYQTKVMSIPKEQGLGRSVLSGIMSAIPVVGSIGAAALQRNWALKDLQAQNLYNSPAEQIKRLKEAGLPLATMFGGQGGSTSEQPASTNIDPTLGTAKALDSFFTNRLQIKQLALLDAQTRAQNADASVKEGEAKWLGSTGISGVTNQEEILGAKRDTTQFDSIIKGNEQIISNLTTEILAAQDQFGNSAVKSDILNKIELQYRQILGLKQNYDINKPMQILANRLDKNMSGDDIKSLLTRVAYSIIRRFGFAK